MASRHIEYGARIPVSFEPDAEIVTEDYDTNKRGAEQTVKFVNKGLAERGLTPVATLVAREVIVGDWVLPGQVE